MTVYKAFLSDWFCIVAADTEEAAQRLAAENFCKWLTAEPSRIIVWPESVGAKNSGTVTPNP